MIQGRNAGAGSLPAESLRAESLRAFLAREPQVVRVVLDEARGSTPRAAGTVMYVAPGAVLGTIGGGEMEHRAIAAARALLADGQPQPRDSSPDGQQRLDLPLGPEIGQCCGGRVGIGLDVMEGADRASAIATLEAAEAGWPHVLLLGAGHVGRALMAALASLPVRVSLIDQRAEELARATAPGARLRTAMPEAEIRAAPRQSAFVIATHDHGLDFLLTAEALARRDAAYVGLIGSATKRAAFRSWLSAQHPDLDDGALTCPIGAAGLGDKRPEVIAAHTAAEILLALARQAAP